MRSIRFLIACGALGLLVACDTDQPLGAGDGVFAPGPAGETTLDALDIGHRAMAAGEYEIALQSYYRAAGQQGLNVDTLSAIGSANLALGRLGQAETWLRRAVEADPSFPAAWNNLGVVLIERGNAAEASEAFRRAFALDDGKTPQIRENLRLALAMMGDSDDTDDADAPQFQLIRRGFGDFLLQSPDQSRPQ